MLRHEAGENLIQTLTTAICGDGKGKPWVCAIIAALGVLS
jgi:hypothetical protein